VVRLGQRGLLHRFGPLHHRGLLAFHRGKGFVKAGKSVFAQRDGIGVDNPRGGGCGGRCGGNLVGRPVAVGGYGYAGGRQYQSGADKSGSKARHIANSSEAECEHDSISRLNGA